MTRLLTLPSLACALLLCCSEPPDPSGDADVDGGGEVCNGVDDDGDGRIDQDARGEPLTRSCANECGPGVEECEEGAFRYCTAPLPTAELCDGFDNDCDGDVDEDCDCRHGERRECGIDVGVCEPGVQHCDRGAWRDCQLPYDPSTLVERCNDGLDNDCDGDTDEDCTCEPGETQACGLDEGECQPGLQTCLPDSTWGADCVGAVGPATDVCDGLDNNCDGEADYIVSNSFGWGSDRNEPNNACTDAAPIYNDLGSPELVENGAVVSPAVGDATDLQTYPSLYPPGDEDWYSTAAQEETDCWNPFGDDCAFRLNVQLWLADRELVGGAVQDPEDWRLCLTIGDCNGGTEYCSRGSDWFESSNLYQLTLVWGSPCYNRGRRDVKIRVSSPTGAGCGYYQVYAWFEYDEDLECPS